MKTRFEDELIGIRQFRPEDVPALFSATLESVAELRAWMVWCHPDYGIKDSEAFVSRCRADCTQGKQYSFVIYSLRDEAILGSVGLSSLNTTHRFANVGYWVRTRWTRQNVGTIATRLAARFGFQELRLNRLELVIPPGNFASIRVAEKAGAKYEGILRGRLMLRGTPQDALMYSLVPGDLEARLENAFVSAS